MNTKPVIQVGVAMVVMGSAVAAVAATLIGSSGVTSPQSAVDGNPSSYAYVTATAAPSYCPTGFSYLGDRCVHSASGTQFAGYEIGQYGLAGFGCQAVVTLNHKATGSNTPPGTHVYVRRAGVATWTYLGTVFASSFLQTDSLFYGTLFFGGDHDVLIGRSYTQPSGRDLLWYELTLACQ